LDTPSYIETKYMSYKKNCWKFHMKIANNSFVNVSVIISKK